MSQNIGGDSIEKSESPAEFSKFGLILDLGVIAVPADTQLANFRKKHHKKFFNYDDDINDVNFANTKTILFPGRKLWVRVFGQIVPGNTTSEERMIFLKDQNSVHIGAQGVSLVFEHMHKLPLLWYTFFDEMDNLWEAADGGHRMAMITGRSPGSFMLKWVNFEASWHIGYAFFCFCDEYP